MRQTPAGRKTRQVHYDAAGVTDARRMGMALMLVASLLFLGTHLGISSTGLRGRLVGMLGERGYLAAYSIVAGLTLAWLIWVYVELPRYEYLWLPTPAAYLVPKLVMPVAMILLLGGFLVRNPTTVGMEGLLRDGNADGLTRGVTRITRHPFQWAVALWAASHLLANGDRVSVLFFSTFLILGLAGSVLIDRKKAASLGANHPAPIFRGIRTKRHTYAVGEVGRWCLYDNQEDPYQQYNLAGESKHASLMSDLDGEILKYLEQAEDDFPFRTLRAARTITSA
jgi:uncharacterized membrane protein